MKKPLNSSQVYDVAKMVAVLLVVLAHATRMHTPYGAFSPLNKASKLWILTEYIYQFHMPLFVFLSGAIWGACIQNGKYENKTAFLVTKAKRLLIPYYVFGFLYVAPVMCLLGVTNLGFLQYCIDGIIVSRDSRHLWYLMALFWIFAFIIPFRKLLLKHWAIRLLAIFLSAVLYFRCGWVPDILQLWGACKYLVFFVIGMSLHFYFDRFMAVCRRGWWTIPLLAVAMLGQFYLNPNQYIDFLYQMLGIVMILATAVFITDKMPWLFQKKWYQVLKKNSMGIYLFHPMVIYTLYYFFGPMNLEPYTLCFAIALVALLISTGATMGLRKLQVGWLMGE